MTRVRVSVQFWSTLGIGLGFGLALDLCFRVGLGQSLAWVRG